MVSYIVARHMARQAKDYFIIQNYQIKLKKNPEKGVNNA